MLLIKIVIPFCREATGVVLHKDSKWYQQWQEFKDNNPVLTGKTHTVFRLSVLVASSGVSIPLTFHPTPMIQNPFSATIIYSTVFA